MPRLLVSVYGFVRPIVVLSSDELCLDLVEMGDLGARCRGIARARGAERASEV